MRLHVMPGNLIPIYCQLIEQISDAIACGGLPVGARLPSQRDLAEQLVISPHSVRKAYQQLSRDGIIECRRGQGTHVRSNRLCIGPEEQRQRLYSAARRLLVQADLAGVPLLQVQQVLTDIGQELAGARAVAGEDDS